jgi:hypothetical protein
LIEQDTLNEILGRRVGKLQRSLGSAVRKACTTKDGITKKFGL